ncbi:P-loop containing nucleoside triphosphate hydrolase protein [Jaminaea rosea]|uniref:P-loop containing nucleoside triphosphate hydrolase protein n=1 Tax=Jaminaea rosea TaxID=1569628 RepID=A0A316UQG0_9BASI|nr:P-loop containing nucleoside triphosphate hydrolase protein [Jaminaea rosea]PWN26541.1 P-loop containing nucleoside triphosphate hydrolase protein [Jaminaea rosea]
MAVLTGQDEGALRYPPRKWYRRVPFVGIKPIDDPVTQPSEKQDASPDDAEKGASTSSSPENPVFPEMSAGWLSILTFHWLHRILRIGYSRPLVGDELYSMPEHRRAAVYGERLEAAWQRRCNEAAKGQISKADVISNSIRRLMGRPVKEPRPSLVWSLNEIVLDWFWIGGIIKLFSDLATITSPLLVRAIIETLNDTTSSYQEKRGYGLSVGLFLLLLVAVFCNVHGFYRSVSTGIALRGALIHVIYNRGTELSEEARTRGGYGVGKLTSLVSADVSRIDFVCTYFHMGWTSVVQVLVCLALVIYSLDGVSALPGFALIAILYPTQNFMVRKLFALRRASMPYTDARIKAVVEAVSSIRLIKTYAWEQPLLKKIAGFRSSEMALLRTRLIWRSINTSVSFSIPTLAAVVSLVTYAGTGHELDSATIFSALSFFLLLRTPLQILPIALSAIADAKAALERLNLFMEAPLRQPDRPIDPDLKDMIRVRNATFEHHDSEKDSEKPSQTGLHIDSLVVPRGSFVAIVGPVGSGKSSLLRALIGDLREVSSSECVLGGHTAYCPQSAWLLSATVRENIVFGRFFDEARYRDTVRRCCLEPDFAALSDGDLTVVGEKGVSLSGGQKQRISLARAVYSGEERPLRLLDDCFSALDAQVGNEVFQNVIVASKSSAKDITHVLVTHSLAIVPYADHVVYLDAGRIVEQGSYRALMEQKGKFADLIGEEAKERQTQEDSEREGSSSGPSSPYADEGDNKFDSDKKEGKAVMQQEERLVGSVTPRTYLDYILLGRAPLTAPVFIISILFYQGSTIVSPLWLRWWEQRRWSYVSEGTYMGVYAALGMGQALGLFCMSASFALFAYYTSSHLHARAAKRVMHAPLAFFDTTPQGRITHRFSKDIDAVDNVVGETLRIFISTTVQALGSIILVAIILPEFLAVAAVIVVLYVWVGIFYRPASRELRRLNNILRSRIYEHFSESLTGITSLRTYGVVAGFRVDNAKRIDSENRAYWLSIACQRWLSLRLDFLGACLVLGSALLVVGLRGSIDASAGGVVLSYMVTVQSVFGQMIRQSAEIENNMNSIERLLHYAGKIDQEADAEKKADVQLEKKGWPQNGKVRFESITASHRPGLAPALRDVSLEVKAGQRIGVVGRTGAGKSTLLSSLLRVMEPSAGRILIDDVDISEVGLSLLRRSISVISQDAVLFAGSLRYNLDPFEEHQDAELWAAMRQAKLIEEEDSESSPPSGDATPTEDANQPRRLHLDMEIATDGSNLSQGQRALVSIARALVKKSRILVLDEATASVDVKTDAHIQTMLQTSLRDCTFITVAHRLDTIVGPSDLICVMDQGSVAEYASPEELWSQEDGLFRLLCQSADIGEEEFRRMREEGKRLRRGYDV